ncbi:uncharacterized protein LOC126989267 [Eriocheir sinensis]|uniref:uncharacterized protein LOC126989267 n=1 Tax=Eriocheir sinensis TaxID=95602 RepID=UPI0021CAAE8C|nr:uncharacterized protein LOC126989267 [Eriocheir sinensis]
MIGGVDDAFVTLEGDPAVQTHLLSDVAPPNGAPAARFDRNSPDWAPSLNLGHSKFISVEPQVMESMLRYERALKRKRQPPDSQPAEDLTQLSTCVTDLEEAFASAPAASSSVLAAHTSACHSETSGSNPAHRDVASAPACHGVTEDPDSVHLTSSSASQTDLTSDMIRVLQDEFNEATVEKVNLKGKINEMELNENSFKDDDERVRFYTGLHSYCDLMELFTFIKSYICSDGRNMLTSFQMMILTLMKLRHNFPMQDLAYRFCVSITTCSNVFLKVLDILYVRIGWMVRWPSREELQKTMPLTFREHYGEKITVILSCIEISVNCPKYLQAKTGSSYKTVKFLIGVSPQGSISFISKAWNGNRSEKYITENCGFLDNILPGDYIMADEFDIADSVAARDATLVAPADMRGKNQYQSKKDVMSIRNTANVQIHAKRVMGVVLQKFNILREPLPMLYVSKKDCQNLTTIDKIAVVCCALTNMCPSVVSFQ